MHVIRLVVLKRKRGIHIRQNRYNNTYFVWTLHSVYISTLSLINSYEDTVVDSNLSGQYPDSQRMEPELETQFIDTGHETVQVYMPLQYI